MSGVVTAVAAVVATAYGVYSGEEARKDRHNAMADAKVQAEKQQASADQQLNAANTQRADVSGVESQMRAAAQQGPSSTLLTGPLGVDNSSLRLGRSTLLGG